MAALFPLFLLKKKNNVLQNISALSAIVAITGEVFIEF